MKVNTLVLLSCLSLLTMACGPKKGHESQQRSAGTQMDVENGLAADIQNNLGIADCDMIMLDQGKMFFYHTKSSAMIPYEAESDSVVNCVFTQDGRLYYCVANRPKILLRCLDLNQADPLPQTLTDWDVDYDSCVTETYGTVSPLLYYPGKNQLGLWHEFSWDSYSLTQQKLYDIGTGALTDWDWENWENEELEDEDSERSVNLEDELQEFLSTREDNYYFQDGVNEACLTDKIDLMKYVSDPDYATEPEFEYISSSPDNLKLLFMAILEWGDLPHGILCVSSTDGTFQLPLEDTDCTGYNAQWLDDGSLVYVGQLPPSPDAEGYDENWHYSEHCIKRVYPDGHTEVISRCGDFQLRPL